MERRLVYPIVAEEREAHPFTALVKFSRDHSVGRFVRVFKRKAREIYREQNRGNKERNDEPQIGAKPGQEVHTYSVANVCRYAHRRLFDRMAAVNTSAIARWKFRETILGYYKKHGRCFPWRTSTNPYAVLVSEVMLQQTQAERVAPFFKRWMKEFPTVKALARAPLRSVLHAWGGLGYNRRALALKGSAGMIVKKYGGEVPRDLAKLDALPGIGPYTAAAILAFAWNEPTVFIETNIRTVFLHFFFRGRKKVKDKEILEIVAETLPSMTRLRSDLSPDTRSDLVGHCSVREWYNALMDYGAMLKETEGNPNARSAHYAKQTKFKGSRRELRGKILRQAAAGETVSMRDVTSPRHPVSEIFAELVREGFLRREGEEFRLA